MDEVRKITVKIYNEDYIVKGNDDGNYVRMLADYVDRRMRMIGQRNPNLSMTRVAVLTALNMADELNRLQDDYDELALALEEEKKRRQG
ncbi:MAG: cell division protein ZapA [Syntrophomonadaceae bacterium]|nr:cell division protein ZapA [Syntrophomonadaceae bacterium]